MSKNTGIVTLETTDYDVFKKVQGNRALSERNVKSIVKNIQNFGLKPTVVIVNEKMEVIDGQHRVEALKRLNLPVLYQVHPGLSLIDCVAMNTSGSLWDNNDYINSYVEMGEPEYVELRRLSKLFPEFTSSNIAVILNSKTTTKIGALIKHGTLVLDYHGAEAEERLNYVKSLCDAMPNFVGRREVLLVVLARIMGLEGVEKDRLQEQIQKYGSIIITDIVDNRGCLMKLEDVYNYHKATRVRFISEYYQIYEDSRRPKHLKIKEA